MKLPKSYDILSNQYIICTESFVETNTKDYYEKQKLISIKILFLFRKKQSVLFEKLHIRMLLRTIISNRNSNYALCSKKPII